MISRNIPMVGVAIALALSARGDEQLFGFTRGAETLPQGRSELYQYVTLRYGKAEGSYRALDFETEIEHGFTDRFQASFSVDQHRFANHGVDGDRDALDDTKGYEFGGVAVSGKYRLLSPFKDVVGVALRLQTGYLWHDEVDGLLQHEFFVAPEIDFQKNFRDDTIVVDLDLGIEGAWGKQPAEEYPREMSPYAATGVSYRFASNWFIGAEANIRAEYPMFSLGNFEHATLYAGPSIHYGGKHWWATLTWTPQIFGSGVDEPHDGRTYAEETRAKIRLKVGFNF